MGYTRNKRRANNFRKSRQLQIKKKATRRQYKGGAKQTKKRGQKGGVGPIGSEIKAGFMDQAKKNVAMKLTIEQSGKTLTPEQLQIINNMFPQDESGKVGVEENYLNNKEQETKKFRDEVFGGKRSGIFGFKGKDTRSVTTAGAAAAEAAAEKQQTAADANRELNEANKKLEALPERATPEKKRAAVIRLEAALKAQKEAQKDVESKDNTKILSDKVFDIFKNGGSISFENIDSLTKGQTSDDAKEVDLKEVVFKGPKKCTLTVDKREKGEKITFSYSDTDNIRPNKNYDFVKSGDNVKYDDNSIRLRVQRGAKIPMKQPVKRTLEMTYNEDTKFVFNSAAAADATAAADAAAADAAAADATAAAVANDNKNLLNKVLSVYLTNNLNETESAFSADTIEQTAADGGDDDGGGGGEGDGGGSAPPAGAGGEGGR